ncbi:murein biosynthesis integral membrane protein MurJ [Xylanimonas allomyrinae]|uniref:murein biosynthesis integral membrane protein MurJ n=1 Tax=Xylanimonas allomyrinae TaxID=2509459 RepID=UPI001FE86DBB|nr:lipid II flippase MurJ [Xylanimonas allomyrinae]
MTDERGPAAGTRRAQSVAGAALLITAVTLASRVVGFGRWLAQAQSLGTGGIDGPFNSANILPNILFEVAAGGALAGAVVPLVAGPLSRAALTTEGAAAARATASRSASALLCWSFVVLVPLGALTALLAEPVAGALRLDDPVMVDAAARFLRVFAVQIPVYGLAVVLGGILQAHKRFFWQAFAPLVSSLVVIVVYVVFAGLADGHQGDVGALPRAAFEWLAWGTTVGVAFLALPLLLPVHRTGLHLRPTLRFPAGEGSRAARLAFAGIGALVAQQLSVFVVMRTANAVGGLSVWTVYQYVQQVYLLPYAVLAFPIATSAFPHLTGHAAAGRLQEMRALVASTTRSLVLAVGAGVAALLAAAPFVQLVFDVVARGRGAEGLATGLTWMAPGMVGFALILHLSRALYAVDAGRAAVTATAAGWLVVTGAALLVPVVVSRIAGADPSWGTVLGLLGGAGTLGMCVAGPGCWSRCVAGSVRRRWWGCRGRWASSRSAPRSAPSSAGSSPCRAPSAGRRPSPRASGSGQRPARRRRSSCCSSRSPTRACGGG